MRIKQTNLYFDHTRLYTRKIASIPFDDFFPKFYLLIADSLSSYPQIGGRDGDE